LQTLLATAPIRLDGRSGGMLIERGNIDLFAVALANGQPVGARFPLCQLSPGDLILALPAYGIHQVIAVGHRDNTVRPLSAEDLADWPDAERRELVEGWIGKLAAAVFGDAPSWPEFTGQPGTSLDLPARQHLYAAQGVAWVVPKAGQLRVDDSGDAVEGLIPIAAGLSLRAETSTQVELLHGADALAHGLEVLDPFHRLILSALSGRVAGAESSRRERLAARDEGDRRSMEWGLGALVGVAGQAAASTPQRPIRDPALAAFSAVAAHRGIELVRLPQQGAGPSPTIRSIARANGIGVREVLLRGNWWRSDIGALVGWRGEGETRRPVALLPSGLRRFVVLDPTDGVSVPLDEAIAAEIALQATMLYRPLPERLQGVRALLRFAFSGTRRDLTTILGTAMLAGTVALLLPIAIGFLFQSAVPRAESDQILMVIIGLALAAVGAGAFDLTKAISLLRLQARIEAATQPAIMHRLMALPVNFFREFGTGDLTNRVLSIQTVRRLLADNSLLSLLSGLFAALSFLVIFVCSPQLALVAAVLVACAAMVSGALAVAELRQERARVELRGQEDGLVLQIIESIGKLRVAASEPRIFAVWAALFARQKSRYLAGQRFALLAEAFADTYPILALLALFFTASQLLPLGNGTPPGGGLGLGAFLAANAAFGQLLVATQALTRALATLLGAVPLFERLRPIVAADPEVRPDKAAAGTLSGRIDVARATFRYSSGSRPVLDDVSLQIEPSSFVAFVGPSGSGKSTLLRLLLGFETPESGDILYDGQSLRSLDMDSLRRQIGVVLQNGRITTGSLFDNITSGLPYRLDDAWEAARLAGLAADIEAMPMGMHTLLLEGTPILSGGQRQRLTIARALIGRPRILFFDEATSALDNQSQSVVMQSLEAMRTTRIVIAHRLSTIEHADQIFVIDRGRVVETGTFPELMARDGLFRRLAQRQIL
jgi:NHLM bacteriocin system ABC transporter ATP-binding protein